MAVRGEKRGPCHQGDELCSRRGESFMRWSPSQLVIERCSDICPYSQSEQISIELIRHQLKFFTTLSSLPEKVVQLRSDTNDVPSAGEYIKVMEIWKPQQWRLAHVQ